MEVKDHSISQETFPLWKCSDCDFCFTQHPPTEEECGQYYESEDYISHSDTKESLTDRMYHLARNYMLRRKWKLVKRYTNNRRQGQLLDYGSGTGYFLDYAIQQGWDVEGIEVSESARKFCKDQFDIDASPAEFLFSTKKKYDAITLWHVLEHLYDFHRYIDRFKTLLKSEGTLIIAVPNYQSLDAQSYGPHWAAYDVPRHLWHFKPKDLKRLAVKHQMKIVGKYGMPLDALYVSILSEKYRKGGGLISGGIKGLMSNLKAITNKDKYSSVIYILKKT
ncbi:MAG: class I SAM-dependent methyltransferase [Bacteroidia bacterium]|nr:class I SAM-dependent methyltransferase [Bacteroidia bacterium]